MQVLQSQCLRITAVSPLYISNGNSRAVGSSFLRRTLQTSNRELRLNVSWCGGTLTSATRRIFTLTEG